MKKYGFGVDVGGTTCKIGFFENSGNMLDKWEIKTNTENHGASILDDIVASLESKLADAGISKDEVEGVGIGVPVKVGNDANVAALGEMWKGGGQGCQNGVMVTLGTGVGGGIIINGSIVGGVHGAGGEIGHMKVSETETETCGCGKRGCLEQYASATGIVRLTKQRLAADDAKTSLRSLPEVTAKDVFDAAKAGDAVAQELVEEVGRILGGALGSIAVVIDPEMFVIGGGVSRAGQILLDAVQKHFKERVFKSCQETKFVLASLGNDAGMYGCAKMIFNA